jgi:hypothetical protein
MCNLNRLFPEGKGKGGDLVSCTTESLQLKCDRLSYKSKHHRCLRERERERDVIIYAATLASRRELVVVVVVGQSEVIKAAIDYSHRASHVEKVRRYLINERWNYSCCWPIKSHQSGTRLIARLQRPRANRQAAT